MKLAVFSDIHANQHALEAMWTDLRAQQLDAIFCLGDLVGYGAFPNEVIDFVQSQGVPTIMGNYYHKTVGTTLFVNTGSVGKPKDGDPRAGYILATLGAHLGVEFRRVDYDLVAAAAAVRAAGLPPEFAQQLETGGRRPADLGPASTAAA